MEQKLNETRKGANIDPLPSADSDFWQVGDKKAENSTFTPQKVPVCKRGKHKFTYTSSTTVKCKSCPLGYILSPRSEVKEGKLYYKDTFVI